MLIESAHHLAGKVFKGTELLLEVSQNLLVGGFPSVADRDASKQLIHCEEANAFDWNARKCSRLVL